jgi:enoyl-CoA hydratase/carnithine racemase
MESTDRTTFDLGTADLILEAEGSVAWLTFNRPQARNAMTFEMYDGVATACDLVEASDTVRVLVLRGAGGRAFVSGTDISQFQSFSTQQHVLDYEARVGRALDRIESVKRPTIAMIQGFAVGGGMGLAMCCDMRICAAESQFGIPTARTLGNALNLSNYARMVDLIGPMRAKELMFTARLYTAAEAQAIGFINEVVAAEALEARVRELATTIAGNAPLTIQATKEAIRRIQVHRRLLAKEHQDIMLSAYMSEDFKEGVSAFLEKRPAQWKGK